MKTTETEKKDIRQQVLDAYCSDNEIAGRFTSQDICDNLRETLDLEPREVTEYLLNCGWKLVKDSDRMVWQKEK